MGSEVISGFHSDVSDDAVIVTPSRRGRFAQAIARVLVGVVADGAGGALREIADQRRQFRDIGLDALDEVAQVRRKDTSASTPNGLKGIVRSSVEAFRTRVGREVVVVSLMYPRDVVCAGDSIKEGLVGRANGALRQGQDRAKSSATSSLTRRLGAK